MKNTAFYITLASFFLIDLGLSLQALLYLILRRRSQQSGESLTKF